MRPYESSAERAARVAADLLERIERAQDETRLEECRAGYLTNLRPRRVPRPRLCVLWAPAEGTPAAVIDGARGLAEVLPVEVRELID